MKTGVQTILLLARSPAKPGGSAWTPRPYSAPIWPALPEAKQARGTLASTRGKDKRFICTQCRKTFTATKGTAFYRLRTSAETVSLVVTRMAHGCPLQAIVVAFGYDERTVTSGWREAAGRAKLCRSIWSSNHVIWGRCKPTRSASRNKAASSGWRWR